VQPGGGKARQVVVDRALAQVGTAGNLPLSQLQFEMQAKDFSRFTHGHSFCGHLDLLSEAKYPLVVSSVAKMFSTAVPRFRSPFRADPKTDRLRPGTVIDISPEQ
jgi:hypothetical protein